MVHSSSKEQHSTRRERASGRGYIPEEKKKAIGNASSKSVEAPVKKNLPRENVSASSNGADSTVKKTVTAREVLSDSYDYSYSDSVASPSPVVSASETPVGEPPGDGSYTSSPLSPEDAKE